MNDTLKVAGRIGAELGAAKAEVERLLVLLRDVNDVFDGQHPAPGLVIDRVRNTLSQQADHVRDAAQMIVPSEILKAIAWGDRDDAAEAIGSLRCLLADPEGEDEIAFPDSPEPTDTYTAVDMATAAAQGFRDGQAAVEQAAAQDEQSPEQMLSREQIENIARKVHGDCIRLPGATYQHAAEAAVMYTLERIARRQGAEPECGNCFEGKSNMDHVCRKCGGSGKAEQAQAQDERQAFEAWMVEVEGARIRPRFDRVTAGPFADEYRDGRIQGAWNVWQARAARPTQTEQQPIRLPQRKNLDGLLDPESKRAGRAYNEALEDVELLNAAPIAQAAPLGKFRMGDLVKKSTGSEWVGRVVGWYSTEQTPEGYAVESSAHRNSVQIYPAKALEAVE